MVATAPKLSVRAVGADAFDAVWPLLQSFGNAKMSRDDWRRMLFSYAWSGSDTRGHALFDEDEAVGFLGTLFSRRRIAGRDELVCHVSSWIVKERYRNASIMLLKPILALRDCTVVNSTPNERAYEVFRKLGFKDLESEQLLLPPLASPVSLLGGSFSSDPDEIAREVPDHERAIVRDLRDTPGMRSILLRRGGERCLLAGRMRTVRRVAMSELLYLGDLGAFWRLRALAHRAFAQTCGTAGFVLDARFAAGRARTFAFRRPVRRLYRPAHPDTRPDAIDGLFSELMTVKL